jgi:hypothetical protein
MRNKRSASVSSLIALGSAFLIGAYAQRCIGLTDMIPTERIESDAKAFLGRDDASIATRFSAAVSDGIDGNEYAIEKATIDGMLSLPDQARAEVTYAGLTSLPDSLGMDLALTYLQR